MYLCSKKVLVSSGTQVQPQVILDPDYLSDYLFVSDDYDLKVKKQVLQYKNSKILFVKRNFYLLKIEG